MNLSGLLPLLHSPALDAVTTAAGSDRRPVIAVPDGAKPALIALLAQRSDAPVVVLTGKADHALTLCEELPAWLVDNREVRLFLETGALPFDRNPADVEAEEERLEVLRLLHTAPAGPPPVIVASALSVAQRTINPAALSASSFDLEVGGSLSLRQLSLRLEKLGYEGEAVVLRPGQVSRRGGIIDVFPPGNQLPVRIELYGNDIESLHTYDPVTQRRIQAVQTVSIGPVRETGAGPEQVAALRSSLDFSAMQLGLRPRFEEQLDHLASGAATDPGFYAPFLLDATLLDHLPDGTLLLVDEPVDIAALLEELDVQATRAREVLESEGQIPRGLPPPHLTRSDLFSRLEAVPAIDLMRWATPETARATVLPFVASPSYGGRLRTALTDFAAMTARGARGDGGRAAGSERGPGRANGHLGGADAPAARVNGAGGRSRRRGAVAPANGDLSGRNDASSGWEVRTVADGGGAVGGARRLVVVTQQSARLAELCDAEGIPFGLADTVTVAPRSGTLTIVHGAVARGWTYERDDGPLMLVTDGEIFGFAKQSRPRRTNRRGREAFLSELSPGDFVVHVDHGIAKFERLTKRQVDGVEREYLELHYAGRDRLFVPTDQLDRVSRYVGPSDHRPPVTSLGSGDWGRAKERVRRAVSDLAQELLKLYAAREILPGHAFARDTPWQQEMEGAFPFVETPDQLTALSEIKSDMERSRPMDRIIIGDVGYGKTELAIRAAFKAVMDGRQVAVLAPTTVLAQQHLQTFSERMSGFPVRIEVLSRFRNERDQRQVVADAAAGRVDVLIGTHRILQRDVSFHDLGLVIVDEEQRFGVGHKERLKQLKENVDVLTLSATPIPRTLHMSLSGIRDMSTLETAPEERLPIRTYVSEFDDRMVREAILRELDRGGQVYFVHNRVYNIEMIAEKLRDLVPEADIAVGHGQMPEDTLERVMAAFQRGEHDVLVCTTIIESGLDMPNVNTIIINHADKLGLSQLYQLRGRVGRGAQRAYAYLLYERHHALSEIAQRRLQAVFEAGELGAGFQIAMKDLEIRGAGNLLGAEQSGYISAVGYELYSDMLEQAVKRMRALMQGETPPPPPPPPLTIDLPVPAHVPEGYVTDLNLRLAVYQRFAQLPTLAALDDYLAELADRFGPPPPVVEHLAYVVRVRVLARAAGLASVKLEDGVIALRGNGPIRDRDRLTGVFGEAVRVGTALTTIERRGDWQGTLLALLQRLQPDWMPPATAKSKRPDYGTFAADTPARRGRR